MPAGEYPDGSRIFIGNLASEATSKKELRAMFEAYGPVDEVILHESYGFIQFHTPEAAANAIARESGRTIGGRRIDVQLSKRDRNRDRDDRRGGGAGAGAGGRPRSPPRRESYRDGRRHDSPRRDVRDGGYDRRPGSPDRRYSGRDRDVQGGYSYDRRFDDGRRDSARDRFDRPRSPGGYGSRDQMPRRDRSRSPMRGRHNGDFRRDSRYGSEPRRDGPMPPGRRAPDCCVVAVSRDQRHYANYVMSRIGDSGIRDVEIVHADRPVPAELNALIAREVPFAVVAGPNDEANRTVSISLLKRSPPEDIHGVPIDEAMRILNKELMLYKEAQAEIARAAAANAFPQGAPFGGVGGPMAPPMMGGVGAGMGPAMMNTTGVMAGMLPMQQQAPMMNGAPVPVSGPGGMAPPIMPSMPGNMGQGMGQNMPTMGGAMPVNGGMGGMGSAPAPKDVDEAELLKKQAEIQASILSILQQSGSMQAGGAVQGQGMQQPPPMGQNMMQAGMSVGSQAGMMGGAAPNAPRDPRLQSYQAAQPVSSMPMMPTQMGQYGGQAPVDPRSSYSQPSEASPHMGAQAYVPQQVQQPAYGATSQAPVMSSGSNPNLDKAFNDLMMLKQKGFFDKAKSSF